MHELSIAQALIEQVEEVAARENAKRVERITIAVGSLSGVDSDSLRYLFPLVRDGTVASHAVLIVEEVDARVKCLDCGREATAELPCPACAACGSNRIALVAGRELNIKSIEMEVGER